MPKTALVTGVSGQDGYYATQLLLSKGYTVVGTTRNPAPTPAAGVDLQTWDLKDESQLRAIVERVRPQEIYNFAAYSSGAGMYDAPLDIADVNGLAVTRILEAVRAIDPAIRLCQASSSELFGAACTSPQDETTPFRPRSPYGAAKLYAQSMVDIYRERYGLFACSAILFNHESPRRELHFVTRKITNAAAKARLGRIDRLPIGNLEARRDWGFAGDSVEAMWLMLQSARPADYVVATGITHSVRDLCEAAFTHVGLDYRDFITDDRASFRPAEPVQLVGDPAKARQELGWTPRISFDDLIRMMVDADLARLREAGND